MSLRNNWWDYLPITTGLAQWEGIWHSFVLRCVIHTAKSYNNNSSSNKKRYLWRHQQWYISLSKWNSDWTFYKVTNYDSTKSDSGLLLWYGITKNITKIFRIVVNIRVDISPISHHETKQTIPGIIDGHKINSGHKM